MGWQFGRHQWASGSDWVWLVIFSLGAVSAIELLRRARKARLEAAKAHTERAHSEERIHGMLDSLTEAFVLVDTHWRFLYVNRACEQMYGVQRERMMNGTLWETFPHVKGTDIEEQYRLAMESRVAVKFETVSKRLGYWVETGAFPVAGGISIYVREIEARKQAELSLRESEAIVGGLAQPSGRVLASIGLSIAKQGRADAALPYLVRAKALLDTIAC